MKSIELFAGAGGLAMGMTRAGFQHVAVVEWDKDACRTIRQNVGSYTGHSTSAFVLHEGDARQFDFTQYASSIDFVSGGPPCQPFSMGGKHQGFNDSRDMFPIAIHSVRQTMPKAFVFENVKGLLRKGFATYLEYIILQLTYPSVSIAAGETWAAHHARLRHWRDVARAPVEYRVSYRLLNAANFGVPQRRERVFIVGFRADIDVCWDFPAETHSEDELIASKWISGVYWDRHQIDPSHRPAPTQREKARAAMLAAQGDRCVAKAAWITVRDAIADLPDPEHNGNQITGHVFIPGARAYPGHTGSPLDEPAKTLKAGAHGVPGGENMLVRPDGTVRYFTVREAARIQTFPDEYALQGSWSEAMRQLGNAVPVRLAEAVGRSVLEALSRHLQQITA